jgi:hypothetical protein
MLFPAAAAADPNLIPRLICMHACMQTGRQAQILASGYTAVTGSNPLEHAVKMICKDVEIYTSSLLLLLLLLLRT